MPKGTLYTTKSQNPENYHTILRFCASLAFLSSLFQFSDMLESDSSHQSWQMFSSIWYGREKNEPCDHVTGKENQLVSAFWWENYVLSVFQNHL